MQYTVTFCSMDTQLESNYLWHSCLLLSKSDENLKKLEVVDSWGFYGVPSTDAPHSWWKQFKLSARADVDFIGNHGKWRHEETRYLDRGVGLHGKTFELTEEQFNSFSQYMQNMAEKEDEAIKEAAHFLKLEPKRSARSYPYESASNLIYNIEQTKAKSERRESRLSPFELRVGLDYWGPHVRQSHTCKSTVIKALSTILSPEQIASLTENGQHPTVPRYSGQTETFYLHSTGPLSSHTKKSGQNACYRKKIGTDGVRVFWTIPPQLCEVLSEESASMFFLDTRYCNEAKKMVSRLQQIEWIIQNAKVAPSQSALKNSLIDSIVACYNQFSLLEPKTCKSSVPSGFWNYFSLFHTDNSPLKLKIKTAHNLLNSIYHAIERSKQKPQLETMNFDRLDPVQMVAFLHDKEQKKICSQLGRIYPEQAYDEEQEQDDLYIPSEGYFALDWKGE